MRPLFTAFTRHAVPWGAQTGAHDGAEGRPLPVSVIIEQVTVDPDWEILSIQFGEEEQLKFGPVASDHLNGLQLEFDPLPAGKRVTVAVRNNGPQPSPRIFRMTFFGRAVRQQIESMPAVGFLPLVSKAGEP